MYKMKQIAKNELKHRSLGRGNTRIPEKLGFA
jgi:hypothetical protein